MQLQDYSPHEEYSANKTFSGKVCTSTAEVAWEESHATVLTNYYILLKNELAVWTSKTSVS